MQAGARARRGIANVVIAIVLVVVMLGVAYAMMSFFQSFGGQASKMPALSLLGQPALYSVTVTDPTTGATTTSWILAASFRNLGNHPITIEKAVVLGTDCLPVGGAPVTLNPGGEQALEFDCGAISVAPGTYSIDFVVVTSAGTYTGSAIVIGASVATGATATGGGAGGTV